MNNNGQLSNLSAYEITNLWSSFNTVNSIHYTLRSFDSHVEDDTIKSILKLCLSSSKEHMDRFISVFEEQYITHSEGITLEDLNLDAPRLYSDRFYLNYCSTMAQLALSGYTLAFAQSTNREIRKLFSEIVDNLKDINTQVVEALISTGFYEQPPRVSIPNSIDFVKKQSFLAGFFGDKRQMTVMEISQFFSNAHKNALGKAFLTGFIQVVQSNKLKEHFNRGKEMSDNYYRTFCDLLMNEHIPIPSTLDGEVTASNEAPFSDKLMMSQVSLLIPSGLGSYGLALSQVQRRDLALTLAKIMVEVGAYSEDGANLLIDLGWFEQPPLAPRRT